MTTQNHKFKLTLIGLVMQGMGLMAHASCGTQTSTDYVFSTNVTNSPTSCDLPTTVTSLTINSGAGLSTDSLITSYGVRLMSGNTGFNTFSNSGTLSAQYSLQVSSSAQGITNNAGGVITGTATVIEVNSGTTVTNFLNNGSITGTSYFNDALQNLGHIVSLENNGTMTAYDTAFVLGRSGIFNNGGQIDQITNNATIGSDTYGISNAGTITSITNNANGTISGGSNGIYNSNGTITTITNLGSITGTYGGIFNDLGGVITTLNNAQSGLTYVGLLPTYYKIIITSTSYGTLDGTGQSSGSTTFGISPLSTLRAGSFPNVLTGGFSPSGGLANGTASTGVVTGTQGGYDWTLTYNYSTLSWSLDLVQGTVTPTGPTAADTQESLTQAATALRSVFNQQTAVSNNSLNYDCTVFAENGVCVSGGGRFSTPNSITGERGSTLLVASYKALKNIRIGGFIDQNTFSTNTTGVSIDKSPMYGVFGVWNQNSDQTGYEVRLATNWSNQDITQTRNVVSTSEAGTGTASLKSQAISGVVSYAMPVTDSTWIASPYAGVRKTKVTRGSYTEGSAVTTPLTYSDLSQDITTALAGVRMNKKFTDNVYVTGSVGVEQNIGSSISTLDATGVTGLTAIDFSANYAKTRPVASVGASYSIDKNQRISLNAMYRKEAFQSSGSTTALLMYQVGL